MKRIQIAAAALVGLLLLAFASVAVFRLAVPNTTVIATSSATPEILPTVAMVDCPGDEVNAYLMELDSLLSRWNDAITLADSTARIALSSPVASLQAIRQEMVALDTPVCAAHLRALQMIFTDSAINGFLRFMQEHTDYTMDRLFATYKNAYALHSTYLTEFRLDPVTAYTQIYSPQAMPIVGTFAPDADWQTIRMVAGEPWKFAIPPAWSNPPADDYDKILIKDPSGSISLNLYTKSYVSYLAGKPMPIMAFLVTDEFAMDAFQKFQVGGFDKNIGPLFKSTVADGGTIRLTGAIQAPDGTAFLFDANKTASPFTQDEEWRIYMILASIHQAD